MVLHPFSLGRLFKVKAIYGPRSLWNDKRELVKLIRRIGYEVHKIFMMMEGKSSCVKLVVDLKDINVEEFRREAGRGFKTFEIRPTLIKGLMADLFTFPVKDDDRRFIL